METPSNDWGESSDYTFSDYEAAPEPERIRVSNAPALPGTKIARLLLGLALVGVAATILALVVLIFAAVVAGIISGVASSL